jgi:hypothetical protein
VRNQFAAVVEEKILVGVEARLPGLTRRDARALAMAGKAMVVVGMRRAGKTG